MVVLAALATPVAMLVPWTRSGRRDRNAFATVDAADALDLVPAPLDLIALLLTLAVIPVVGLGLVAAAVHRPRLALVALLGAAGVLALGAVIVLRSPIEARPGVPLSLLVAVALAAGMLKVTSETTVDPSGG